MKNILKNVKCLLIVLGIFALTVCGGNDKIKDISFEAQYIRTDGVVEDITYPIIKKIQSVAELKQYYSDNKEKYNFVDNSVENVSFTTAIDKYDELYFGDSFLLLLLVEENNGDTYHEVKSINEKGKIFVNKISSNEDGKSKANWHIILEMKKKYSDIDYSVSFDSINLNK